MSLKIRLEYSQQGISQSCSYILRVDVHKFLLLYRWRLFRRPIIAKPENVVRYSKAAIALHNYLRTTESGLYCPPGYIDGEDGSGNIIEGRWKRDDEACTSMQPVARTGSNR